MSTLQVDTIKDTSGNLNPTLTRATPQVTTSGTQFDFTGIPAGVKKITIIFDNTSLTAADNILVQIGDAGGIESSGYVSTSGVITNGASSTTTTSTSGYVLFANTNARAIYGHMTLTNVAGNTWDSSHVARNETTQVTIGGGGKSLSDTLTQIRITRTGTDTFDGGQVNIMYE